MGCCERSPPLLREQIVVDRDIEPPMGQVEDRHGQHAEPVVGDRQAKLQREGAGPAAQVIPTGIKPLVPVLPPQPVGFTLDVVLVPDALDVAQKLFAVAGLIVAAVRVILKDTLALHGAEMMQVDLVSHLGFAKNELLAAVEVGTDKVRIRGQETLLLALAALAAPDEHIGPDLVLAEIAAVQGGVFRAADTHALGKVIEPRARLALRVGALIHRLSAAAARNIGDRALRLGDTTKLHPKHAARAGHILVDGRGALALRGEIVRVILQQGNLLGAQLIEVADAAVLFAPLPEVNGIVAVFLDGLRHDRRFLVLDLHGADGDLSDFVF